MESNFICCSSEGPLLGTCLKGDFGSGVLRADHFAILNIRFRGGFASFHIVRAIISFGDGGDMLSFP